MIYSDLKNEINRKQVSGWELLFLNPELQSLFRAHNPVYSYPRSFAALRLAVQISLFVHVLIPILSDCFCVSVSLVHISDCLLVC